MLKALAVLLPLSLLSAQAIAGTSGVDGDTTCTIIFSLSKKEMMNVPCSYQGSVGSSMSYIVNQINFRTPNGYVISTVNNSNFDHDAKGNMRNIKATTTINGEPATTMMLDRRTLNPISNAQIEQLYNEANAKDLSPDLSNVLNCFKPTRQDNGFCTPHNLLDGYI